MTKRIVALDSLRGLAAVSVAIHHSLIMFPAFYAPYIGAPQPQTQVGWMRVGMQLLAYSPLHVPWGGHEAVILFFLLSGFVLALPYLGNAAPPYAVFVLKRFCRIYIPYICSVALSLWLFRRLSPGPIPELSDWFNGMWSQQISLVSLLDYVFMSGRATHNVNTVLWTLIYEMRISIIFPILMGAVVSRGWKVSLAVAGALSGAGLLLLQTVRFTGALTVWSTVYYAGFFTVGATLAQYRVELGAMLLQLGGIQRKLIALTAVMLISWRWMFANVPFLGNFHVAEWAIALGAAYCIVAAVAMPGWQLVLSHRWLTKLGELSYSFYLVHVLVLLTLAHSSSAFLPFQTLPLIVPTFSIPVAFVYYQLVERPSIRLGKMLTDRLRLRFSAETHDLARAD